MVVRYVIVIKGVFVINLVIGKGVGVGFIMGSGVGMFIDINKSEKLVFRVVILFSFVGKRDCVKGSVVFGG